MNREGKRIRVEITYYSQTKSRTVVVRTKLILQYYCHYCSVVYLLSDGLAF